MTAFDKPMPPRAGFALGNLARRCAVFALIACLMIGVSASLAHAAEQRRIALVIGNDDYETITSLDKAVSDAETVSARLREIGFHVVTAKNVGRRGMGRVVREFEQQIGDGDLALFFYAGHGFSISGQDYLIPVDMPQAGPGEEALVRDESFMTNDLADRFLRAGAKTAVLVLDACRNNPFEQPGTRSLAGASGLANKPLGEGIFVLYSAGQYQTALDNMGPSDPDPNSVFTRALLDALEQPGASLVDIAKTTQIAVRNLADQVGHPQLPSYYDQILGDVYLVPGDASHQRPGSTKTFEEGGSTANLPARTDLLSPDTAKPLVEYYRTNAGWQVNISLPEPAVQFGYRVGPDGQFIDTGTVAALDHETGKPAPKTWFELPWDQEATDIFVTWRDRRGEEAGVHRLAFDPQQATRSGAKGILLQTWTSWVVPPSSKGGHLYFSHLLSYRCGLEKIEYAFNNSDRFETWPMPECDFSDPLGVAEDVEISRIIPASTRNVQVRLTFFDGSQSELRNYNIR